MPSTRPQGGPSATPRHASASAALGASLGASDGSGPDGSGPDGSGGFGSGDFGSGDFGPGVPPAALRDQVRADFQRLNRNRRWMLSIFCGLCAAALAMVALVHPGHPGHGTDATGLIIGLQAASGALLVSAAFGWPSLGRLGLLRIVGAVALFGTALLVPLIDHGSPWSRADWHTGLHCLVHGAGTALTLSVAVVLVAGRLLRNHAPVSLMLGLGTAQIAWGPLHIMCRHGDAAHLMIWHALVPPVAMGIAWGAHRLWRRAHPR